MSISSYLKQLGHTVRIIDLNLLENASDSYFATMLKQENADIYGFSIAAGTVHSALGIAKKLKELKPTVTIVFGGPQATLNHELILKNFRFIDVVISIHCLVLFVNGYSYICSFFNIQENCI